MSYSTVKIFVNAEQHKTVLEFCHAHGLDYEVEVSMDLTQLDEAYKKPTKALKAFCGKEYGNSKGLIQPKAAIQLILSTAKRLNLNHTGGILELDETLREVLNTTETSILLSSLPSRVNALFTDT
jgi:hypothetical protein